MRYLLTALLLLPSIGTAQQLNTFSNGQVADAEKINENFSMAAHKLYSGDTYLGRALPWTEAGVALGVTDQKFLFLIERDDNGGLYFPAYNYGVGMYFPDSACVELGYIMENAMQPRASYVRGAKGRVYSRPLACGPDDPGSGFSPPGCPEEPYEWESLGIYVDFNNPLEVSVLPEQLYRNTYPDGCVSENPALAEWPAGTLFYQELQNVPSITGIPGVALPSPSIDVGLQ